MNDNKEFCQSVSARKSLVLDKFTWDSISRRSKDRIFKIDKFPVEVSQQQYRIEESQAMANKLKEISEVPMKAEREKHINVEIDGISKRFSESNTKRLFKNFENSSIGNVALVAGKNNLTRRKQDEYKKELRQFIENKRQRQLIVNEADREQQKLERLRIDSDLAEQLKNEQIVMAERREAKRIIEMESVQLSGKACRRR